MSMFLHDDDNDDDVATPTRLYSNTFGFCPKTTELKIAYTIFVMIN